MIGNGFDINLGLKTSYKDFYNHVLKKYNNNDNLKKNIFLERISKNIEDWQDFEKMMGILTCFDSKKSNFAYRINNLDFTLSAEEVDNLIDSIYGGESEVNWKSYYSSLEFFTKEFQLYVIEQQNSVLEKMSNIDRKEIIEQTISRFWEDFDEESKRWYFEEIENEIKMLKTFIVSSVGSSKKERKLKFTLNFLNFNYTSTLTEIVNSLSTNELKKIIINSLTENISKEKLDGVELEIVITNNHVHATTKTGMFLGVDNFNQINPNFFNNIRAQELLIKPERVQDRLPTEFEAYHEIISNSDLIYIFGMSLGETDKMWWQLLINFLNKNNNSKIAIHSFSPNKILNPSELSYDINIDEIKNLLLRHEISFFNDQVDRKEARKIRSKIIPVMNSKIMFRLSTNYFWTKLEAITMYEELIFNSENIKYFGISISNYSHDLWKEIENNSNQIVLYRSDINEVRGEFYKFIRNNESTEIYIYKDESNYPEFPNSRLIIDNKLSLVNEHFIFD